MRDDEPPVVEDEVGDQPVAELRDPLLEPRSSASASSSCARVRSRPWLTVTLRPREGADQLVLVVAGQAERVAGGDHAHDQPQHAGGVRTAVDEVAEEDRAPSVGRYGVHGAPAVVADQP